MTGKGRMGQRLRRDRGFTLVELVTTIIILGILAAVAVPKFVSLDSSARTAAAQGAAAALQSTSVILYAQNKARPAAQSIIDETDLGGMSATGTCAGITVTNGTASASTGTLQYCLN